MLDGELDIATTAQFVQRFDEFFPDGLRRIVVDVSQLAFVDVAGLRALTALGARSQQQLLAVQLTGMSKHMRRVAGNRRPGGTLGRARAPDWWLSTRHRALGREYGG